MPLSHAPADSESLVRTFALRVSQGAVWVLVAGLFSLVEAAVLVTEHVPGRFLRPRRVNRGERLAGTAGDRGGAIAA
ncbi:hypothetical protein [Opitutus sp. ER46]|uniref:hypothetical protein n=1 Tax=Opitutus sp. ER46 TaxID=2161864 RepID=UPI0011B1FEA3|nr:hypothetical protein [Opitutus sp. ER46]